MATLDSWIDKWHLAFEAGKNPSVPDFERAVNLRARLKEQGETERVRGADEGAPSLAWLSKRHIARRAKEQARQARMDAAGVTMDEVAGVVSGAGPVDVEGDGVERLRAQLEAERGDLESPPAEMRPELGRAEEPEREAADDVESDAPAVEVAPRRAAGSAPPSRPTSSPTASAPSPTPADFGKLSALTGLQVRTIACGYADPDSIPAWQLDRILKAARALGLALPGAVRLPLIGREWLPRTDVAH